MSANGSVVAAIAREEWRLMWRNRVARVALVLAVAVLLTASLVSFEQQRAVESARAQYQAQSDADFAAQPDRHPHRVVHYGQFVFRALGPLAFFDFGVDAFTGNMLFLEGHRQNTANFSDARQSSLLLRFGQLTPAFVLQVVAPLLIIFLAHGSVARERQSGTLRLLLAQGLGGRQLVWGKLLGHGAIAALVATPALVFLLAVGLRTQAPAHAVALLALGYLAYLLAWAAACVFVSARVARPRDALLILTAAWMLSVVVVPRVAPEIAQAMVPTATRAASEIRIGQELALIGDSHNPDDPHFSGFRQRVLDQYGVDRVEDLPVNYGGLLMVEGERLTSELFERYAAEHNARERAQGRWVTAFGVLSPTISLGQFSMTLAQTDVASHQGFLDQAEAHRYAFVQALNTLQAQEIRAEGDRDQRLSSALWQPLADFEHRPPPPLGDDPLRVWLNLGLVLAWLGVLLAVAVRSGARLGVQS